MKKKPMFLILFLSVLLLSLFVIFFGFRRAKNLLKDRSLVVIVETNSYMMPEDIAWYEENKKIIDIPFALFTSAKYSELKEMEVEDVLDIYAEDMVGKFILSAGRAYGKKVLLTDSLASSTALKDTLKALTNASYEVDLLI